MKTRSRAALLALTAALALGACSKAPATTDVNAQGNGTATQETATPQTVSDPGTNPTDAPRDTTAPTAPTDSEAPTPDSVNAQLKVAKAEVKADPDAGAKTVTTLNQKTALGSKTTMLVLDKKDDWLQVSLPVRPNGTTGWIEAKNVDLRENDMRVDVDLAAHKATISKAGQVVIESPIAIGTDANPTPKGTFFVTDLVQTDDNKGAYGPFALGLSGHSDTLTEFGGGDGQIALHGTNEPSSIGKSVSHGCVRLPNDVIAKFANMTPLGTPVVIA